MSDWRIARKGTACGVCKRAFPAEETFVSVIFENQPSEDPEERPADAFERLDACPACFETVERAPFSRWTTKIPDDAARQPILDLGMARDFLVRLAREGNPERENLMFILSLLLLRKRKVKLTGRRVEDETDLMDLVVKTEDGEEEITVPSRTLSEDETKDLEEELGRLFGLA